MARRPAQQRPVLLQDGARSAEAAGWWTRTGDGCTPARFPSPPTAQFPAHRGGSQLGSGLAELGRRFDVPA